jgi:hypothetical protein
MSADGHHATYRPESIAGLHLYTRWRQTGGEENTQGVKVPAGQGEKFNESEMIKNAYIKPPTWYFVDPDEEYAESVRLYRTGESARRSLYRDSRTLYDLIKKNDQTEINNTFGMNVDGSPNQIRSVEGVLVPNDAPQRRLINEFEHRK